MSVYSTGRSRVRKRAFLSRLTVIARFVEQIHKLYPVDIAFAGQPMAFVFEIVVRKMGVDYIFADRAHEIAVRFF